MTDPNNAPASLLDSVATLPVPNQNTATRSSSRAPRRAETKDSEKAGRLWARTVDDPWWPCILTCDGGGIRGYSTLLILKALMHEIWLWEKHYDALELKGEDIGAGSPVEYFGDLRNDLEASRGRSGFAGDSLPTPDLTDARSSVQTFTTAQPAVAETLAHDTMTASHSKRKALSEEELLPCHYFDFMYGTSTGGLIATILGRLRMTVTEGLELYREVGNDLFGSRRSSIPLMTKYYHEPLEKAVRKIVAQRCSEHEDCDGCDLHPWAIGDPDTPFDVDKPRMCQSACLTATHDGNLTEAYLLRTYPHYYDDNTPNWITRYNEGADSLPIWAVTRATSAAPFYFEMVHADINGETKVFKDGGIRENNPSGAAYSEFYSLYNNRAPHPALLLSLGTGLPNKSFDGFAESPVTTLPSPFSRLPFVAKLLENLAVFKNVLIKYTEGEHQHIAMRNAAHGEYTWYKRLNVEGLETMPLDDWRKGSYFNSLTNDEKIVPGGKTLSDMEDATNAYLSRDYQDRHDSYAPPKIMLRQAAEKLVLQRRARESLGGERWDVFVGRSADSR